MNSRWCRKQHHNIRPLVKASRWTNSIIYNLCHLQLEEKYHVVHLLYRCFPFAMAAISEAPWQILAEGKGTWASECHSYSPSPTWRELIAVGVAAESLQGPEVNLSPRTKVIMAFSFTSICFYLCEDFLKPNLPFILIPILLFYRLNGEMMEKAGPFPHLLHFSFSFTPLLLLFAQVSLQLVDKIFRIVSDVTKLLTSRRNNLSESL